MTKTHDIVEFTLRDAIKMNPEAYAAGEWLPVPLTHIKPKEAKFWLLDLRIFEIFHYSSGHLDICLHLGPFFLWIGSPFGRLRISIHYVKKRSNRNGL